MKDRDVIDAFVVHLRAMGYPGLVVDRRPDEKNRQSTDIDAVAGPFSIEHTSIDTLPNQRRDSDWFMRAAGGGEAELVAVPPCQLRIYLEYRAVTSGQNWPAIRTSLKIWVVEEAPALPDGHSVIDNLPGIPFALHVFESTGRSGSVGFARFAPEDSTLSDRIRAAGERKAEKLAKYRAHGSTTVLLLESDDIVLMNEVKMRQAVKEAFPSGLPAGIDQLWFADTSEPANIEFRDLTQSFVHVG